MKFLYLDFIYIFILYNLKLLSLDFHKWIHIQIENILSMSYKLQIRLGTIYYYHKPWIFPTTCNFVRYPNKVATCMVTV